MARPPAGGNQIVWQKEIDDERLGGMKILAIETSCDETALAVVDCKSGAGGKKKINILANEVASQIEIHRPYGGVFPTLAKREHLKNLPILFDKIKKSHVSSFMLQEINLIAVTVGPGLEPALWTGINFANDLGEKMSTPVVGINHLEGHIYSNWLPSEENSKLKTQNSKIEFPAICLVVSGGHTILLLMTAINKWKILGETRDDAVGESFDKVARMLGLPYPGGPEIEKLATIFTSSLQGSSDSLLRYSGEAIPKDCRGHSFQSPFRNDNDMSLLREKRGNLIEFPRPMLHSKNYNFSFSGLKTAVLYYLRNDSSSSLRSSLRATAGAKQSSSVIASPRGGAAISKTLTKGLRRSACNDELTKINEEKSQIAASFQTAVIDVLVKKTMRAAAEFNARSILLGGGVAANKALQKALAEKITTPSAIRQPTRAEPHNDISLHVPELKYNTDNAVMIAAAACLGNHYPTDKALPNLNL